MRQHVGGSRSSKEDRMGNIVGDREIVAPDDCAITVVDPSSLNQTACILRGKFPLKTNVFSSFKKILVKL